MKKKVLLVSLFMIGTTMSLAQSTNWTTSGNSITTTDFFGTTNAQPIWFRTSNQPRMVLSTPGRLGLGVSNPTAKLDMDLGVNWPYYEAGLRVTYPAVAVPPGNTIYNESVFDVRQGSGGLYTSRFVVKSGGKIGVNVNEPLSTVDFHMHHQSEVRIQAASASNFTGISFRHSDGTENWRLRAFSNFPGGYGNTLALVNEDGADFWIAAGKTLIGDSFDFSGCSDCDEYELFVRKGIRTEQVKVDVATGVWADYVFSPSYKLRPLSEVDTYIKDNGHLPDVPSSKEVEAEGINLAETDALLLQKIEEITLYLIELKKENEELKKEIEELKQK